MSTKRPLVLLSGGLDSTYLLYSHMKKKESVDYIYICGGQGKRKINCERETSDHIVRWLHANRGEGETHHCREANAGYNDLEGFSFADAKDVSWSQPIAWMLGAMMKAESARHSCVEIAYVMGDEALQLIESMETAWNALWKICKQGEVVPLKFPLRVTSKVRILEEMPGELYALTWVCETPNFTHLKGSSPCGRCRACETRLVEEYRYKLRNGRDLSEQHQIEAEKKARQKEWEEEQAKKTAQETQPVDELVAE